MKEIATAETTTVNWGKKRISWLLNALRKTKLLHQRIANNDHLYKIGLKQSPIFVLSAQKKLKI